MTDLRILHVSDTHGTFIPIPPHDQWDVMVHSGDLLPNGSGVVRADQPRYQKNWAEHHKKQFKNWIGDKPALFCDGNHDFTSVVDILIKHNINAINITNRFHEIDGIKFYGFPYIPYMGYVFNWERTPQSMIEEVGRVTDLINDGKIDVLVAHCPIAGILDKGNYNMSFGNTAMKNAFAYKIQNYPMAYLHGHVHESHGTTSLADPCIIGKSMLISNSATVARIITIKSGIATI